MALRTAVSAPNDNPSEMVAAVDLGSNSFHMIVGRLDSGGLTIVDRMRERVRLGAGLDAYHRLKPSAHDRALDCLQKFGERIRGMPGDRVRVVGTNTMRKMRDSEVFLYEARLALGHPVEIIAGLEEARLIYLGVRQSMPEPGRQRLVIDIGGGSTECIIGRNSEMLAAHSLFMGCVSYSIDYFERGNLSREAFDRAELAAQLELQPITRRYRELGWQVAVGCAGTVHSIRKISTANGWGPPGTITADGLRRLKKALTSAGHLDELALEGLQDDRRPVIAGGVAILSAVFTAFDIDEMASSPGALREGALFDLVGRIQHEDVRDRTIGALRRRHNVDEAQAKRVRKLVETLWDQVARSWGLDDPNYRLLLGWAADLHEVGLSISYTGYHKHSAYLVTHADMPGFSKTVQLMVAAIIRAHRRRMKASIFEGLGRERGSAVRLSILFRLAVALCRSRSDDEVPAIVARVEGDRLALTFSGDWIDAHPMSMVDLGAHAEEIEAVGIEIEVVDPRR